MRTLFQQQLETLNLELIKMGNLCEESIGISIKALQRHEDHYKEVLNFEIQIDRQERIIQELCMQILLQQQPVASDLRKVYSILKIISDMERIGDMALDIAKITRKLPLYHQEELEKMANATTEMVTFSIDCFAKQDLDIVQKVIMLDDVLDKLFYSIKHEIIKNLTTQPQKSEIFIDYLMIAKYFEKIGDHATNIAEWVRYSITGHYTGEE